MVSTLFTFSNLPYQTEESKYVTVISTGIDRTNIHSVNWPESFAYPMVGLFKTCWLSTLCVRTTHTHIQTTHTCMRMHYRHALIVKQGVFIP